MVGFSKQRKLYFLEQLLVRSQPSYARAARLTSQIPGGMGSRHIHLLRYHSYLDFHTLLISKQKLGHYRL